MLLKRYHTIYPQNIFRAQIIFKNVAPSEDKWAEGVLCRDIEGKFSIVNRKVGHGEYALDSVYIDTLGLASGFRDGNEKDIFEGDIIRICRFSGAAAETELPAPDGDDDEELPPRKVYADVPEGSEELSQLDGVVFMNGGMFFVQFYDEVSKCLNALPLYMFFGFDMLPAVGAAVKVIGNMYDDGELYSKTLNTNNQ